MEKTEDGKVARWVVGCTMPGYMPDSDPSYFANWKEARDAFISGAEHAADAHAEMMNRSETEVDKDVRDAKKYLLKSGNVRECQVSIGQYVYFLERM